MLTLHVGLHKTGSTALQAVLANMTKHELQGKHYRGNFSLANNDGFLSKKPGHFGFLGPDPDVRETRKTIQLMEEGKDVILSSESFLGSMRDVYPNAGERALDMVTTFAPYGKFRVVLYLRAQHRWLESVYAQIIQEGDREDANSFAWRALEAKNIKYSNLVADLKAALGAHRLVVRSYPYGTDIASDFLSLLEVPVPRRFMRRFEANQSIDPGRVALLRSLNRFANVDETRVVRLFLQGIGSRHHQQAIEKPSASLSREAQIAALELALSDWQQLVTEIQGTHLPNLPRIQDEILRIAKDEPKPCILDPNGEFDIQEEYARTLISACRALEDHRTNFSSVYGSFRRKVKENPSDLTGAAYRFLLRRFTRSP